MMKKATIALFVCMLMTVDMILSTLGKFMIDRAECESQ